MADDKAKTPLGTKDFPKEAYAAFFNDNVEEADLQIYGVKEVAELSYDQAAEYVAVYELVRVVRVTHRAELETIDEI